MPRPRMRPSFRVDVDCSRTAIEAVIERRLAARPDEIEGTLKTKHCVLEVTGGERRFWTPSLDLMFDSSPREADAAPGAETQVWGTFSPRAEIWTSFVFAMGTLAIVSCFATMFGFAQLAMARPPFALGVPVVAALLAALLYLAALVGQGLSIREMYALRAFLDDCLREAEALARDDKASAHPEDAIVASPESAQL